MLKLIENTFSCLKFAVKAILTEIMTEILDRGAAARVGFITDFRIYVVIYY